LYNKITSYYKINYQFMLQLVYVKHLNFYKPVVIDKNYFNISEILKIERSLKNYFKQKVKYGL